MKYFTIEYSGIDKYCIYDIIYSQPRESERGNTIFLLVNYITNKSNKTNMNKTIDKYKYNYYNIMGI